jgi:dTDP-4-amino-4,6-dideoxy-D-galactose acyltransferase
MNSEQLCELLEWDSGFFGLRIARVAGGRLDRERAADVMAWCGEQRINCLYFLCAPDDDESVTTAETQGFHLVDVRIELNWRVQAPSNETPTEVRPVHESDLPALQQIAETAYGDTRFFYDRHFGREPAVALYRQWVAKSVRDEATAVLVIPHQGAVGGFITCQVSARPLVGRIGLVGVRADARGSGLGQKLLQAARHYFHQRRAHEVFVTTQGRNLAAQRLYQAQGFRTCAVNLWYHKWFEQ